MIIEFSNYQSVNLNEFAGLKLLVIGDNVAHLSCYDAYQIYSRRLQYLNIEALEENELAFIKKLSHQFGKQSAV